jgi:hypothetical protein
LLPDTCMQPAFPCADRCPQIGHAWRACFLARLRGLRACARFAGCFFACFLGCFFFFAMTAPGFGIPAFRIAIAMAWVCGRPSDMRAAMLRPMTAWDRPGSRGTAAAYRPGLLVDEDLDGRARGGGSGAGGFVGAGGAAIASGNG